MIGLVLSTVILNVRGCAITDLGSNHNDYKTDDYDIKKVETDESNDETGVKNSDDEDSSSSSN